MSKHDKIARSGFVIKLSSETVQKLADEEQQAKAKASTDLPSNISDATKEKDDKEDVDRSTGDDGEKITTQSAEFGKRIDGESKPNVETSTKGTDDSQEPENDVKKDGTSWGDYAPYITYEGEEAIYTDPSTQQKYTWSKTTNSWVPSGGEGEVPGRVYSYENDTHIYTEADGSKCFWDAEKKAWIPKVDDDFLAYYQMSYGFVDNTVDNKKENTESEKKKEPQKKADPAGVKRKNEPQWFEQSEAKNTKVYVSNLPQDLTEEEFVDLMQKCGLVERDPSTQKMKIKLYYDKEQNCFKGDALCTYIKIESVDLALKLLDGSDFKGQKIKVERAHFQLKGEYNPALKPKKKKKKELEKIKKMQQKLFDWRPEKFIGERSKHERVVIVKNLFHPSDFDKEVQLILDYQQDLREEATKCGEVRKVVIYDRHPEGVAQITMKEPEMADAVVQLMNGRWFGKKQISAEIWDGRTKYRIAETDAALNQRIEKWDNFLEGKEEPSGGKDKKEENNADKPEKQTSTQSEGNTDQKDIVNQKSDQKLETGIETS